MGQLQHNHAHTPLQNRHGEHLIHMAALEALEPRMMLSLTVPAWDSRPDAPVKIYLDFTGAAAETWNSNNAPAMPAFDDATTSFTAQQLTVIQQTWAVCAEAMSPFNVDVTTVDPDPTTQDYPCQQAMRLVIGGTSWAGPSVAAISVEYSFDIPSYQRTSYIFSDELGDNPNWIGDVCAHEAGHEFGLGIQAAFSNGVETGPFNTGDAEIGAIMGAPYYSQRELWWDGPYEDDMAIISGSDNGFGYAPLSAGQTIETATPLGISSGAVNTAGVIETPSQSDFYSFTTSGGNVNLNVNVAPYGPMLQAQAVLEDASGNVVATADNPNTLGQTISATVPAGTYYLVVESAQYATGVSVGEGYSVGQYDVTGTVPTVATPTFAISGASGVNEQSPYTLSLSANDPGQTVSEWVLNWGDGDTQTISGDPSSVTHTYADGPNAYTISATAVDGTGAYSAANTVSVAVAHVAPTVILSGASNVSEGANYVLDLSGTDDSGHSISSWLINWGDGTTTSLTGNPSSVNHSYATGPNTYTITASATDDVSTYQATNSVTVNVTHVPPTLAISGASSVNEGSSYTLNLSATDPNHTISSWLITWGDGSTSNVSGNPSSVTHIYPTGPHTYTVSAAATDDVSTYAAASTLTVSVAHVSPTLALAGASSVNEGTAYVLGLSSSDPNHTISSWFISWGDGATSSITGNPSSVNHTYAKGPNNYTITATATDDVSTYAAGNSISVTVNHVAPTLTLSGASSVNEGSAYTLGLSATDPNHTISAWLITWGDGSTSNVTGNPSSVSHTYAIGPHNYTITATATDDVSTYNAGNSVTVAVSHVAPTLTLSGASTVNEGSAYTLGLSGTDPNHAISSWHIVWGDGSVSNVTGNPSSVSHTYATGPHTYAISATATDDVSTYTAGNTLAVSVAHVAPTLTLSGATSVNERSAYTLGLSASDPGHTISSWLVTWGDGSTTVVPGNPSSVTHTYATGPNSYTITATATDNVGTYTAGNSLTVSVAHVAPTPLISGAASAVEGSVYTLGLSVTDSGHTISGWLIMWGDGSTSEVTGNPSSVTHIYTTGPSDYTITAAVTDNVGTYAAGNSVGVAVGHAAPTLTLSGASSVNEGSAYTLGLSAVDPGHTISSWLINWGDGSTSAVAGNPSSVVHTYATGPDTCVITATATDNVSTYTAGNALTVAVNHVAPTLTLSGQSTVNEGSLYTLGLSASDPGHTIASWVVNWGDGNTQNVTGNPSSVTHTYSVGAQSCTITAIATDDVSTYAAANSVTVAVSASSPTLTLSGASAVAEGSAYSLGLSAVDPGHTISEWVLNWGDGDIQTISGNPASVTHTYAEGPQTYTISATATDDASTVADSNSVTVSVTHVPPTLTIAGGSTVDEGSPYTLNLSASDGDHTISSWLITWGDGSTSSITGNPSSAEHTYSTGPNNYTITATATDDVGTYAAGDIVTVAVAHVAPALAISGASEVAAGSVYTLGLSGSDPGHTIENWLVNWGDGSTSDVTGNPQSVTHTYASGPDDYTITATATDDVSTYAAGNSVSVSVDASVAQSVLAITGNQPTVTGSGATFSLTFSNAAGINAAAAEQSAVYVTGPVGYQQTAEVLSVSDVTGTSVTLQFAVTAPADGWTWNNNGVYSVFAVPPVTQAVSGTPATTPASQFVVNDPAVIGGGRSLKTARNLGQAKGGFAQSITGTVLPSDPADFYRFSLTTSEGVSLNVSGLIDGISVQILNSAAHVLSTQTADSGGNITYTGALGAGIYYLKVSSTGSHGTNYDMDLSTVNLPANHAGSTLTRARSLGAVSSNSNVTVSDSVNPFDPVDVYSFAVAKNSNLVVELSGLVSGTSVELMNSKGAAVSTIEPNAQGVASIASSTLAGRYYLEVESTGSAWADYSLNILGATAEAKLKSRLAAKAAKTFSEKKIA